MASVRGAPCPHPGGRHAQTAPRPRLHRLLSLPEHEDAAETLSASSNHCNSIDSDPEDVIRTALFEPSEVVQNDIFRAAGIMAPSYNRHYDHRPGNQQIHRQQGGTKSTAMVPHTTPRKRPGTGGSRVTRTGSEQHCGLSAQISREISYRTPLKTPARTPSKKSVRMMTPLSKDLFRAKASAPLTDSKLLNLKLTHTASMSSSDDGSSPEDAALANQTKKRPPNLLEATPTQPRAKRQRVRKTPFPGKAMSARKKLKRVLTPPRGKFGSHIKKSSAAAFTLSTSYDGVDDYKLSSAEHDPTPFQVELPSKKEVVACAKLCELMDGYTALHRDFNFALLAGVSRRTLEKEYERSTPEAPMIAGACHREVVKRLLECAEDIVVEGFFREYTEVHEGERVEACIFSSERLRQIVVCFRGSTANQARPLGKGRAASSILHKEQPVPVLSSFQSAYFGTPLERTVFALLDNLATRKPFFDVVATGHSFGAAMATIAAVRYAASNSQMRVSCHTFGSPGLGGEEWRNLVHSVPNLRIYRAEKGSDPYVSLPDGKAWVHCGHSIQMGENGEFLAHRFGQDPAAAGMSGGSLLGFAKSLVGSSHGKDHEIRSYVEHLTISGDVWFEDFCGVEGKGVSGSDNEPRTLS
ncbi:hypothetical protein ACHAXT_001412 [Thalassiosira profunda]